MGQRLRAELRVRLCGTTLSVRGTAATIRLGEGSHRVDALVERPLDGVEPQPVVVFELVVQDVDWMALARRLRDYDDVPSLRYVVLLDTASCRAMVHGRGTGSRFCDADPVILDEPDALLELEAVAFRVPLRSFYRDRRWS